MGGQARRRKDVGEERGGWEREEEMGSSRGGVGKRGGREKN